MLNKIMITVVAGSLAVGSALYAIPAMAQSRAIGSTVALAAAVPVERHPVLRRAINQLNGIEGELAKADNDLKGHKEAARDLIRKAINELKAAIASDKH